MKLHFRDKKDQTGTHLLPRKKAEYFEFKSAAKPKILLYKSRYRDIRRPPTASSSAVS